MTKTRLSKMSCYRVWFIDGSALLVDAESIDNAKKEAYRLANEQCSEGCQNCYAPGRNNIPINRVEKLS